MRRALVLVVLAPLALLPIAPVACSSKTPNPPMTPTVTLGDGGVDAGDERASVVAADAGAPSAVADAGSANVAGMMAATSDATIDAEVAKLATKAAPGMTLEGTAFRDTLAPNGHLNAIVTLQPSRCYTIIGYSPKEGVTQLDLQLLAPPLFNIPTNRAPSPKNEAIIGKGKEALCPVSLVPIPYKVDAIASKGAGRVGVYLFSRNK
jgi:hypothetical protein